MTTADSRSTAADHRIDIRRSSRHLVVRAAGRVVADTDAPVVLYESGFAPRWYVPRAGIDTRLLDPSDTTTFCPYKGTAGYYDIGGVADAAWYYRDAFPEASRVDDLVSFEPDKLEIHLDGQRLHLEAGQHVITHGIDRDLRPAR